MGGSTGGVWTSLTDYQIEAWGLGVLGDGGQMVVEMMAGKEAMVRGSTDGVWRLYKRKDQWGDGVPELGTLAVVECKAFAESTWKKWIGALNRGGWKAVWEAFPYYAWQISSYGHGVRYGPDAEGLGVLMVIGIKDIDDHIVDGVNHGRRVGEIVSWYIPNDELPYTRGEVKARVLKVLKRVKAGRLDFGCDVKQFPCEYYDLHEDKGANVVIGGWGSGKGSGSGTESGAEDGSAPNAIPDETILQAVINRYADARARESQAKKDREAGDKIIKEWIKNNPEMKGQTCIVSTVDEDGGKRLYSLKVEVSQVEHEAQPEEIIPAKEAWTEVIEHEATEEKIIPAKEAWTEVKRTTIKVEEVKGSSNEGA